MADEQDGHAVLPVQLAQQREDLGLNGHIQRRGWLVGQQQLRAADDGGGDHDPLEHTTGKLVRIAAVDRLRVGQFRLTQGLQCPLPPLGGRQSGVHSEALLHLRANTHDRIKAGHGLLKDHGQIISLDLQQFLLRTGQDLPSIQRDAALYFSLIPGQQATDAHGSDGFAAARLAHKAEDLPRPHGEGHPVDRPAVRGRSFKTHAQVVHVQ